LLNATGGGTGPRHVINHTGTWNGVGVGADSRDPANYHTGQTIDDLYNPTQQMQMAGPNELKSIFTTGRYDINQYVTFRATGMYAERDNTRQVAGYPLNSLTQATNPVYLSGGSYYNPLGQDLYFARRITELPRVTKNNVKSYHFDAGFEGYFEVGSRTWTGTGTSAPITTSTTWSSTARATSTC